MNNFRITVTTRMNQDVVYTDSDFELTGDYLVIHRVGGTKFVISLDTIQYFNVVPQV